MVHKNFLSSIDDIEIVDNASLPKKLKGFFYEDKDFKIIFLDKSIETEAEKNCILAEELGHYKTSIGNIIDQSKISNSKQEMKARAWGYEKLVSLENLVKAYKHKCADVYEMAEYLNVTDEYFHDAITYYKNKYGRFATHEEYVILLDPIFKIVEQI